MFRCSKCKRRCPEELRMRGNRDWCKPCWREYANQPRFKEAQRARNFKIKYGITIEQYDQMHADQDGKCKICRQPETALSNQGEPKPLAVDHNHDTGEVRGLLCHRCNIGLGHLSSLDVLAAAMAYLLENDSSTRSQNETAVALT